MTTLNTQIRHQKNAHRIGQMGVPHGKNGHAHWVRIAKATGGKWLRNVGAWKLVLVDGRGVPLIGASK